LTKFSPVSSSSATQALVFEVIRWRRIPRGRR
jgi:hypothetical protein